MRNGPVDFFEPTCLRCGADDPEHVHAWLAALPGNTIGCEPGVYCSECALELGLLNRLGTERAQDDEEAK